MPIFTHLSIFYTRLIQFRFVGALEPIPAAIGREVEYNWTGHQSITGPIKDMKTLKQKKNI